MVNSRLQSLAPLALLVSVFVVFTLVLALGHATEWSNGTHTLGPTMCAQMQGRHGVVPGKSWGTLPIALQRRWDESGCDRALAKAQAAEEAKEAEDQDNLVTTAGYSLKVAQAHEFKCKGTKWAAFAKGPRGEWKLSIDQAACAKPRLRIMERNRRCDFRHARAGKTLLPCAGPRRPYDPDETYDAAKVELVSVACAKAEMGEQLLVVPPPVPPPMAPSPATDGSRPPRPDIYVVVLDSLSRFQLRRGQPKLWDLLRNVLPKTPGVDVTELTQHRATGKTTDENMGALLAGYPREYSYTTHPPCSNDCEWSFQALKEEGYTTLYTSFNHWMHDQPIEVTKKGVTARFDNEEALFSRPWKPRAGIRVTKPVDYVFEFTRDVCGAYKHHCMKNAHGTIPNEYADETISTCASPGETVFDVLSNFWLARANFHAAEPKFFVMLDDTTHDGEGMQGASIDAQVVAFLKALVSLQQRGGGGEGKPPRPFVMFVQGDHGPPFPVHYPTQPGGWQGERGKPAAWVVSAGLSQAQLAALHSNGRKLTSHYDNLATMLDLGSGGTRRWRGKHKGRGDGWRGLSLVSDIIPDTRTCDDAGIPKITCSLPSPAVAAKQWLEMSPANAQTWKQKLALLDRFFAATLQKGDPNNVCLRAGGWKISPVKVTPIDAGSGLGSAVVTLVGHDVLVGMQKPAFDVTFPTDRDLQPTDIVALHRYGGQQCMDKVAGKPAQTICVCGVQRERRST